MSSEPVIRVSGVSKCYPIYARPQDRLKQALWRGRRTYYREFWALRDVSFEVGRGETVGIVGRNGSGKSSLLQVICGTLSPTSGEATVQGRVAALLELGAGFSPDFSGRENVYLNAGLYGLTREQIDARLPAIEAFAGIGDFIDQPVKTYSSGMFVRLAFAVIAHVDADVLVIDEALAVGDGFFTQKCMRFLRRFREHGTILFVSHDTGAVISLCERAVWLEHGELRALGPAKEVCEAYIASLHEQQRRELGIAEAAEPDAVAVAASPPPAPRELADQRLTYLNCSPYRNDLEVFSFNPDAASFGAGGARVVSAELQDESGRSLAWAVGGETVALVARIQALVAVDGLIVGFYVKDRLGQPLFGDNTYLSYADAPVRCAAGQVLEARFAFRMPLLPRGDYAVDVAVAEGTQQEHVQHHWAHDVLLFKSHSSSVSTGLVGIPMLDIRLGAPQ